MGVPKFKHAVYKPPSPVLYQQEIKTYENPRWVFLEIRDHRKKNYLCRTHIFQNWDKSNTNCRIENLLKIPIDRYDIDDIFWKHVLQYLNNNPFFHFCNRRINRWGAKIRYSRHFLPLLVEKHLSTPLCFEFIWVSKHNRFYFNSVKRTEKFTLKRSDS